MSIIRSDNPPHARNICTGKKTIEWTKAPLPKGKMFCYETITGGGCGMVIGEAEVVSTARIDPTVTIKDSMIVAGCVDRDFLRRYARGETIYANFLINPVLYKTPIPVTEFKRWNRNEENAPCAHTKALFEPCETCKACNLVRPPQSWCYVEDLKGDAK